MSNAISDAISNAVNGMPAVAFGPQEFLAAMGMTAQEYVDTCLTEDGDATMALCVHECVIPNDGRCKHGYGPAKTIIAEELAKAAQADALAAEIARLQAENKKLAAKKQAPKPAASPSAPIDTAGFSKPDAKLLEIISKFRSPVRPDGKVPGTFAVKVHAYFHAAGIQEPQVRTIIEDAAKRGIISRMSIPCNNGKRMMLYFDAREKASYERKDAPTPAEKAELAAVFGL